MAGTWPGMYGASCRRLPVFLRDFVVAKRGPNPTLQNGPISTDVRRNDHHRALDCAVIARSGV